MLKGTTGRIWHFDSGDYEIFECGFNDAITTDCERGGTRAALRCKPSWTGLSVPCNTDPPSGGSDEGSPEGATDGCEHPAAGRGDGLHRDSLQAMRLAA